MDITTVSTVEYIEILPKTDIFLFKKGLHLAPNSYCTDDDVEKVRVCRFEKGRGKYFIYVCGGVGYVEIGNSFWKLPPSEGDKSFIETLSKLSEGGVLDILTYVKDPPISTDSIDAMKNSARE